MLKGKFIMTRHSLTIALLLCLCPSAPVLAQGATAAASPADADLKRFGDMLLKRYRAEGPGGAVLVARGDTVLFRGARGEADVGTNAKLRPETLFRIASVTKQFTAAGVLKLVEAGKVKLDDPLSKYVPGFPNGHGITIEQLLNHTSGVKIYTAIKGYTLDQRIRRDLSTGQLIDTFKNEQPDFKPGAKWNYSNGGYVLLGAVIESASGEPWHAWLERALFKPLGMANTGYALDPRLAPRVARGHSYDKNKVVAPRPISMTQPHSAGSLVSNIDDLLKWNRALHEGRVLKEPTYVRMITPTGPAADPTVGYGFGLESGQLRTSGTLSHGGGIFGFISALAYLPGPDITVAILENDDVDNDQTGGDSADNFGRKLAAIALGDPYPEMRPIAVEDSSLQTAEGVYRFSGDVTRTLRVSGGKLTAQRGAKGDRVPLVPIAADEFLYPDGFNRIKLLRNAAGKVSAVRLFPNGDGAGEIGEHSGELLPSLAAGVKVSREALERLAGSYVHEDFSLKVYTEGDQLVAQLAGQPPVSLKATSATNFEVQEEDAVLFFPAGTGPAAQATIKQGGREMVLKRLL